MISKLVLDDFKISSFFFGNFPQIVIESLFHGFEHAFHTLHKVDQLFGEFGLCIFLGIVLDPTHIQVTSCTQQIQHLYSLSFNDVLEWLLLERPDIIEIDIISLQAA